MDRLPRAAVDEVGVRRAFVNRVVAHARGDRHVHLHVLSADLCSDRVKIKKHYNTFHPKLGFFLHYKDVMDWFDATPSYYEMVRRLPPLSSVT